MPKSPYLANLLINQVFRDPVPVGLYAVLPQGASPGVELSGGGYSRVLGIFGQAVNQGTSNTAVVLFPEALLDWGGVLGFGLFDALSGGNPLYSGPIQPPQVVVAGKHLAFKIGQLVVVEF